MWSEIQTADLVAGCDWHRTICSWIHHIFIVRMSARCGEKSLKFIWYSNKYQKISKINIYLCIFTRGQRYCLSCGETSYRAAVQLSKYLFGSMNALLICALSLLIAHEKQAIDPLLQSKPGFKLITPVSEHFSNNYCRIRPRRARKRNILQSGRIPMWISG